MRIPATLAKWLQLGLALLIVAILVFFILTPPARAVASAPQPASPEPNTPSRGANP